MRIDIVTIFPEIFESPFNFSMIKRAQVKNVIDIQLHNLRDYSTDKHHKVDDYAFSGGAGMVMLVEPLVNVIEKLKSERNYDEIIYTSPDGETYNQRIANQLSLLQNIIIICGHYKGIDQRVRDHFITKEISIGDYVLSGGEYATFVIVDSVSRLIPGVLSDESSALTDSFQDNLLAPPVYSRPAEFRGMKVPEILLSGNTKQIDDWLFQKSIEKTEKLRPDLLKH